ncbi:tyrosine-type recombinase/integrase [Dasania marina]|uniref:tyrosine-type recombinase/integrase n=1 Tax=Dasania marina TaxID=471499 RepID=UPI00036E52C7|nr:site-specific integrase [Dasania marina]
MAKLFTRTNSPYFWTRFTGPKGQDVRLSLSIPKGREFKEAAQLKASQLEVQQWDDWKSGKFDRPDYSFDDLMIGWVEDKKPGDADLNCIAKLSDQFTGMLLKDIKGKDIAECKRVWRKSGISNNTIRRRLSTFSSAITYARSEWEWDIENPVSGRLPAEEIYEADHLSYKQAQLFVDALKIRRFQPYNASHLLDFFILAIHTGMRKSEILSLKLEQIDFEHKCIHLKASQQKGVKRTATPLNDEAIAAIDRRLDYIATKCPNTLWLFPSPTSKGDNHLLDVTTGFNSVRKEVGLPNIRIHDLRHTFASWLVQRGNSLYETSKALRHASIKPTERYAHLELEHLRKTHDDLSQVPVDFNLKEDEKNTNNSLANEAWKKSLKGKHKSLKTHKSAHYSHTDENDSNTP